MKKKILIVGGTGFLGYHLAKKSLQKKWSVTSISLSKPKKYRYLKKVKYIICDISKKESLKKKLNKNFDYVVNLGGHVDHSNKKKTYNSHYEGCKNLASFFLKKKIKSFVQIGSSAEYGTLTSPHKENYYFIPKSIYGYSKFLSSDYLIKLYKEKNFPATILRFYQVYGPNQDLNRFIPIIVSGSLKNKKIPCSHGRQYRDFIFVSDAVDAIFKALMSSVAKGEIFNIASGKPLKIKNVIYKIINFINRGEPLFNKIKLRKEEILKTYANINKSKKILKWTPKISFSLGLYKTIKYYKTFYNKGD